MKKVLVSLFLSILFLSSLLGETYFESDGGPVLFAVQDARAQHTLYSPHASYWHDGHINRFFHKVDSIWLFITHKKGTVLSVEYEGTIAAEPKADTYFDADRVISNKWWKFDSKSQQAVHYSWFRVIRPHLSGGGAILNLRVNGIEYQIATATY